MIQCPEKMKIKSDDSYEIRPARKRKPIVVRFDNKQRELRFTRNEKLKQRFSKLSQIWHEEMDGVSSIQLKISHWAYEEIVNLGEPVVPLIMDELKSTGDGGWFAALAKILKVNPVLKEHRMDMDKVLSDWVRYTEELRLDF